MGVTKRPARNLAASVRQRLLNLAKERGEEFNLVLARYAVERFLFRLSRSRYRDRFVLKGATLIQAWGASRHRATRDLDLLGHGDNDPAAVAAVVRSICRTPVEDDGLVFDTGAISAGLIREERDPRPAKRSDRSHERVRRGPREARAVEGVRRPRSPVRCRRDAR
jgi:hypothetical protein